MTQVNARHLLVRNKTLGSDTRVDAVINNPEGPEAKVYEDCKKIYLSPLKKCYVESCLLASQDLEPIEAILEIPVTTLEAYRYFFFDTVGLDKLSKLEVVSEGKTDDERTMKLWAVSQGLEFIAWRLGKPTSISPVEGLQDLHTLCVYKSKEALFSGNASESSKEATKWVSLTTTLARLLKVWIMDSGAAKHEIQMALKTLKPEFESFDNVNNNDQDPLGEIPGLPSLGNELKTDLGDDIGDLTQLDK